MNIGDVFFRALIQDKDLQLQAQKVGDAAGDALGQHMGKGIGSALSTTLRGGLKVVAAGAAVALTGLAKLDELQSKFAADTGVTADEARDAAKAINSMAGRNLQGLDEIEGALAAVHTEMGLTGKEAEATTEKFLKYATATGQNAVDAVKAFDDIQDAWNITAADSVAVMDDLIASHQKYGGSISENQAALAQMAPQLKALNADWRDGIGLLNLFAASGIDASKATAALNKAVKNLKPGQNLDDLIREITAIQDPTLRAKKAIEVFGAKGGVALANALRPGITSLKDFEVSAFDAGGATDRAAKSIEDSLGNRFKLAIKAAGSALIGFGQSFGPVLTGLAGAASLAGAFHLDTIVVGALKKIGTSTAVHAAATSAGATISLFLSGAFSLAEHLVEAATEGLKAILEKAGIKVAASQAGTLIGGLFGSAMGAAEHITEGLIGAFTKLPGVAQLRTVLIASGTELGTLQGTAMGAAAGLAIEGAIILALPNVAKAVHDWLEQHGVNLNPKIKIGAFEVGSDKPILDFGEKVGTTFSSAAQSGIAEGFAPGRDIEGRRAAEATGKDIQTAVGDGAVAEGKKTATRIFSNIRTNFKDAGPAIASIFTHAGRLAMTSMAQGIEDERNTVLDAFNTLTEMLKHQLSPTAERARLIGELASKALAKGLRSKDPEVRAQAIATRELILDRLRALGANARNIGKAGMEELRKAMHSKDATIRNTATQIYRGIYNRLHPLILDGYTWGKNMAANLAKGIHSQYYTIAKEAGQIGNILSRYLRTRSPAEEGPLSVGGGPEGWGSHFGGLFSQGILGAVANVRAAGATLAGALAPPTPWQVGAVHAAPRAVLGSVGSGVGTAAMPSTAVNFGAVNIHLYGPAKPGDGQRLGREFMIEVANGFRQEGARNGLHPRKP